MHGQQNIEKNSVPSSSTTNPTGTLQALKPYFRDKWSSLMTKAMARYGHKLTAYCMHMKLRVRCLQDRSDMNKELPSGNRPMQGRGYFWDLRENGSIKLCLNLEAWKCRLTPFTVAQDKDPAIPVAAKSLWPLTCWNLGFESPSGYGCLSPLSVAYC